MLPPLRRPPPLPTNSSSSFASSTTRQGLRWHRPRNWALSTLQGTGLRGCRRRAQPQAQPTQGSWEPGGTVGTQSSSGP